MVLILYMSKLCFFEDNKIIKIHLYYLKNIYLININIL